MNSKILVVDDHEAARMGIAELLGDAGYSIAGLAAGGTEAVKKLQSLTVDAIVLDVRMPAGDGLGALGSIREGHPDLPIVVFSAYDNPTYIARAAALGAYDYVLKNGVSYKICRSLSCAVAGQAPPPESRLREIRKTLMCRQDQRQLPDEFPLTSREFQVLIHIALGLSNKEIARSLGISVETVKEHVQNILRKIKANDRTDAAVRAVRLGLVD